MTKYQIHPLAETYPPMSEAEMEALTADIAARGLQRPIVLFEGKILDGRNRYIACQKANVDPTFAEYDGDDPLGQVNSLNLNRDLTAGQRAIIAARQWTMNGKPQRGGARAKGEQTKNLSLKSLCQLHRTNEPSVIRADEILTEAPDLAKQIEACALGLADAFRQLQERRDRARKQTQDADKASRMSAEYRELISDGKTTPEKAMEEIVRKEREERERLKHDTEARQIWFEQLEKVIAWAKSWVSEHTDEHLAWYTAEDAPETGHHITANRIDFVIVQLERIKSFTCKGELNGRAKRSQKASPSRT